jgi:hypothetical protein
MAGSYNAERADVTITLTVTVRVEGSAAGWRESILHVHADEGPIMLTRAFRPGELPAGSSDPWWQGGMAIQRPEHAPNGHALTGQAGEAATRLTAALKHSVLTEARETQVA